jgi:hypothetical protein
VVCPSSVTPLHQSYSHLVTSDPDFNVLDAEGLKAHEKKLETNRKRRERDKRKREEKAVAAAAAAVQMDSEDDDEEKPAKKLKKPEPAIVQKITIYVEIQAQASWQQQKSSKKAEAKPVIKKGPSFFTVEDSFDTFKQIVAKAIPCKLKLLPVGNMEWRYEKPRNDPRKPLTSMEGYKAMTMSLSERKSGFVVYISIPPPKVDDVVCFFNNSDT